MATKRKIDLMHELYGTKEGEICAECEHYLRIRHRDSNYRKCSIYGVTASEASDWKASYPACGLFPNEQPENGVSIIRLVCPERKQEEDIPGQMTLWEVANEQTERN